MTKTEDIILENIGKKITELSFNQDTGLHFVFEDGAKIRIADFDRQCCEYRYMTTDDKLSDFIGSTLMSVEVREILQFIGKEPESRKSGDVHDVSFLVVTTSLGAFTCETHNEHNGYYGGFSIQAEKE